MITGDYDKLNDLAKYNVCFEHRTHLEVAWYGEQKTYVLRCDHDHFPDAITRNLSLTEELKAGTELPEPLKGNVEKSMRRRAQMKDNKSVATGYAMVPATDLGTGKLLLPEEVKALVDYAESYTLDPGRGHVCLMYGKPYITLDGYLFTANRSGVEFSLQSRPLKTKEIEEYKVGPTDHAWLAEINFTRTGQRFGAIGIVTYDEMTAKSEKNPDQLRSPVVAAHPWQLAQKRAEWQVLRRAFPIGEVKGGKVDTGDER